MAIIYKIENLVNQKFYIGSSHNKLEKRKSEHLAELRKNKHYNKPLQNSWNKYGEANFQFLIVEEFHGLTQQELLKIEIEKINELNPEYNICREYRAGKLGRKVSEAEKIATSKRMKGRKHTEEAKQLIREKRALQVFTKEHREKIGNASRGRKIIRKPASDKQREKARKLLLSYSESGTGLYSEETTKKRTATLKRVFNTPEMKEVLKNAARNRNRRTFYCFKNDSLVYEFTNQAEAAEQVGCTAGGINAVLQGIQKSHRGYVFKYNK